MAVVRDGVAKFWELIVSPKLYKIYNDGRSQFDYEPNSFERWGDRVLNSIYMMCNLGIYTSPVIATILYRKGYFVIESLALVTKVLIGLGLIVTSSYFTRALGRLNNPVYLEFNKALSAATKNLNKDTKKNIAQYDFDFSAWPCEFKWNDVEVDEGKPRFYVDRPSTRGSVLDAAISIPCKIISYIVAHTIGIKMVYPGSIKMLQSLMFPTILQGRMKLIVDYKGERFKLGTRENNDIDAIFIDRRKTNANGSTLVICCEGNAGFYEFGITMTPIEANYSVLGWNHPGFGGSTGTPYPSQEQNAVDVVVQFAIYRLGFDPEDILLFGWSIGGFTASWAAMNYPDIKGMILDATFDDILPLAIPRMPATLEPIVRRTIREHINLNIYEQVSKYNGPVLFIRRTEDEIICTEDGNLSTNRGNHLVAKFLKYRYPKIFDEKRQALLNLWLASDGTSQSAIFHQYHVDRERCTSFLSSYIEDNALIYPMQIGENFTDDQKYQMALFLVDNYLNDFHSTHCPPLPVSMFRIPWTLSPDSSFVKL